MTIIKSYHLIWFYFSNCKLRQRVVVSVISTPRSNINKFNFIEFIFFRNNSYVFGLSGTQNGITVSDAIETFTEVGSWGTTTAQFWVKCKVGNRSLIVFINFLSCISPSCIVTNNWMLHWDRYAVRYSTRKRSFFHHLPWWLTSKAPLILTQICVAAAINHDMHQYVTLIRFLLIFIFHCRQ